MVAYANKEGWNWEVLNLLLPSHICDKIKGISLPNCQYEDFFFWCNSNDDTFFRKWAYSYLSDDDAYSNPMTHDFNHIWEWVPTHQSIPLEVVSSHTSYKCEAQEEAYDPLRYLS